MSARASARPHDRDRSARRPLAGLLAAALAAGAGTVVVGAVTAPTWAVAASSTTCSSTTASCTVTYGYTGSLATFTVPVGVSSVDIAVSGAQGGAPAYAAQPGRGGLTAGTLPVSAGQEITLMVGQAGRSYGGTSYGGGGGVGNGGSTQFGSGGGGTFVFAASGELIAAAGGGGGGGGYQAGGGAGAGAGGTGGDGGIDFGGTTATGGTQSAGGSGGTFWLYGSAGNGAAGGGPAATGAPGQGGSGGSNTSYPTDGGAGGGGGFYGGGGGAPYNGGGGGSGYAASSLTVTRSQSGVGGGDGNVDVTYQRTASQNSLVVSPTPGGTEGQAVTLTTTTTSTVATPTGTVAFAVDGTTIGACGAVAVDVLGRAECTTSSLVPGARTLTAAYGGDMLVAPSAATPTTYAVAYRPLDVTTTSLPPGQVGQPYSAQLEAQDGHGPYTWDVAAGSLPPGVTLSPSGELSGTPTRVGSGTPTTFRATDAQDTPFTDSQDLTLVLVKGDQAVAFDASSPEGGNVGGTWQVVTSGGGSGSARVYSTGQGTTADACSVSGDTVSFDHVGWCEVVATQPGDADWNEGGSSYLFGVEPKQTEVVVTVSDQHVAYGHPVTASATSSAVGTIQWAVAGTDLGGPIAVTPDIAVDAPALYSQLPDPGNAYEVSATFVPEDPTVDGETVGRDSFAVGVAEADLHLTVAPDSLSATVGNAVAGDGGVPSGDVTFLVDNEPVGTATLGTPASTMVGTGLLPPLGATATFDEVVPAGSSHHVTALYDGDDNFTGASDSTVRDDPEVIAAASSARPASNGWYRTPVTVTFTCTPAGAPLVGPCPAPVVLGHNGAGQAVSRTVLATNGGATTASLTGIDVDRVAPEVGVLGKGRRARCVASDALSGVARCTLVRTRVGRRSRLVATATDRAGNLASSTVRAGARRITLLGAPRHHGRFTVHAGSTYTVVAWGRRAPALQSVVPSGRRPSGAGHAFHGTGRGRWVATVTVPRGAVGAWKLGVRTATGQKVVRLRVVR